MEKYLVVVLWIGHEVQRSKTAHDTTILTLCAQL